MPALFYGLYVTPLHGWAVPAGRYWGGGRKEAVPAAQSAAGSCLPGASGREGGKFLCSDRSSLLWLRFSCSCPGQRSVPRTRFCAPGAEPPPGLESREAGVLCCMRGAFRRSRRRHFVKMVKPGQTEVPLDECLTRLYHFPKRLRKRAPHPDAARHAGFVPFPPYPLTAPATTPSMIYLWQNR